MRCPNTRWLLLLLVLIPVLAKSEVFCGTPPVARDDVADTAMDRRVLLDLLANDSDADGDLLSLAALPVADCGGAGGAQLLDHGDGTVTFTPPPGFQGECTVSYQVTDGDHPAQAATATVFVGTSAPPTGDSQLLTLHPDNPRYFVRQGDLQRRAVYLTGSHIWNNFVDWGPIAGDPGNPLAGEPEPPTHTDFLNFITSRGHNFIRGWTWENSRNDGQCGGEDWFHRPLPWPRSDGSAGNAADGQPRFDLHDPQTGEARVDPDYLARLRDRVLEARDRPEEIWYGIMLFQPINYGVKGQTAPAGFGDGWFHNPFRGGNNVNGIDADTGPGPEPDGHGFELSSPHQGDVTTLQRSYVRQVVDALGDLDNVIWEIGNESWYGEVGGDQGFDWQEQFIDIIRGQEQLRGFPEHPIWMTAMVQSGVDNGLINDRLSESAAPVVSPARGNDFSVFNRQTGPPVNNFGFFGQDPIGQQKVAILDTDHLCGGCVKPGEPAALLHWVWRAFTRGYHPIFMDSRYLDGCPYNLSDQGQAFEDAREAMGDTLAYAKRMDLAAAVPQSAAGEISNHPFALYRPDHTEALVFYDGPTAAGLTCGPSDERCVTIQDLPAGSYTFEWLDVEDNAVIGGQGTRDVAATSDQDFFPPSPNRMMVFFLQRAETLPPAETVFDSFGLNGTDRVIGSPLAGTASEIGAQIWVASIDGGGQQTARPVFDAEQGDGLVTHETVTPDPPHNAVEVNGALPFDPSAFPALPVLTLEVDVRIVEGQQGWLGVGFADEGGTGLWGSDAGKVWMFVRDGGDYQVRAQGLDFTLVTGSSTDWSPGGWNRLRLEYVTDESLVSAWINDEQVLFRSFLPGDLGTPANPVTVNHVAFQMHLLGGGAAGAMAIDDFGATAATTPSMNRAPYYGVPHPIPGSFMIFEYDLGGEGVAYHDSDRANEGGFLRPGAGFEGVDLTEFDGTASTVVVDHVAGGEWLEYSIDVAASGSYTLDLLALGFAQGGQFMVRLDGQPLLPSPIAVPVSASSWIIVPDVPPVDLTAGTRVLRLELLTPGFEIQRIELTPFEEPPVQPVARDDVFVAPFDPGVSHIVIPADHVLDNDEPRNDIQIVSTDSLYASITANGDIEYTPRPSFWSSGWDLVGYTVAHLADATLRASADVLIVAGGAFADDDHVVAVCEGGSPPVDLPIHFSSLLAGDTPSGRVEVVAATLDPAYGTLDPQADRFLFTGTSQYCADGASFTYQIQLEGVPEVHDTGTVHLLTVNPVLAVDDELDHPWASGAGSSVLFSFLKGNDLPQVQELNVGIWEGSYGARYDTVVEQTAANGFTFTFHDGFWQHGYDEIFYTVVLGNQNDKFAPQDQGTLHIRAQPLARPEALVRSFTPADGTLVLPASDFLDNDGPPSHIRVLGAEGADHGEVLFVNDAGGGTIRFTPEDSFWDEGFTQFEYVVGYTPAQGGSATLTASAVDTVLVEPAFRAVTDSFPINPATGKKVIHIVNSLLPNDRPGIEHLTIGSSDIEETTDQGGTVTAISQVLSEYTPPSGGLDNGYDWVRYTVHLASDTSQTRIGRIYFFEGAVPPLEAAADAYLVAAGEALELPFEATLLANDSGESLSVAIEDPPRHGGLTVAADSVTYVPDAGYVGPDVFTYAVIDVFERRSARARVEIAVEAQVSAVADELLIAPGANLAIPKALLTENDVVTPGEALVVEVTPTALGSLTDLGDTLLYEPPHDFQLTGPDTFTYTLGSTASPGQTSVGVVVLHAEPECTDVLADDYESGALTAWSTVLESGGTLLVDEASAIEGLLGLGVAVGPVDTFAFLGDDSPQDEPRLGVRFLFDPRSLGITEETSFTLFSGRNGTSAKVKISFGKDGGGLYQLRTGLLLDGGSWTWGPWVTIEDRAHRLLLDWRAASAAGASDGALRLWLDSLLATDLTGLDTDQQSIDDVRIGLVSGHDRGTVGSFALDAYGSCRGLGSVP